MLSVSDIDSYPRQKARTRGFQLGRPRAFAVSGSRVLFIRSSGGNDPVGSLWVLDLGQTPPTERRIVDAATLLAGGDLPAEERARRERMREVTSGITAFSLDEQGSRAAFVVSGVPYFIDVASGTISELPAPGPVIDPRMSPDGTHVAFVSGNGLHAVLIGSAQSFPLCLPDHADESWGLADFIAAEELDRVRGHWWFDGGLLVERFDNSGVDIRWIADPAQPEIEPTAHRYPSAGTANAVVELWLVGLDGVRTPIAWDTSEFPYLASVHDGVIELLSRDQRTAQISRVDTATGSLMPLATRVDDAWHDVMPGVPLVRDNVLIEIVNDTASDTFRLALDGVAVSPVALQVRALLHADAASLTFLASPEPDRQAVYRLDRATSQVSALTDPAGWAGAVVGEAARIEAVADADACSTTFTAVAGDLRLAIESFAEVPLVDVRPAYSRAGASALPACILWPSGHVAGSGSLPVIMSPYGGPHAQRVVRSASAYATDQWIADQGFAVVIIDGRGTPGRGPAWERAVHGDLAEPILADQVEGLQALGALHPDLDLGRVGIRGWSFGGYLAALAVLDRPDAFHAAVAGAPVTDWALYDTAYSERYLGLPDGSDAYELTSLLPRAPRLTRPLVLIHGLADDNVLAAHTLLLSSALLAAGRAHSVIPLSGVTHMTPQEIVAENLLRLEIDFFRSNLPTAAAATSTPNPPVVSSTIRLN
ncbi:MAG: prolyl oligopeptidase family serine peptidase [Actinobacteria bacterium]|uniref:Unannotated protein n=1 Tax=freshwater metagenome TaxID=449393 RepID=A0A6J7CUQ9_9ZZZZ|nr:prolyl oligopeptidase family serine peptidase [Actinomycetota bacterium]